MPGTGGTKPGLDRVKQNAIEQRGVVGRIAKYGSEPTWPVDPGATDDLTENACVL